MASVLILALTLGSTYPSCLYLVVFGCFGECLYQYPL